jgi:hypothetical protein
LHNENPQVVPDSDSGNFAVWHVERAATMPLPQLSAGDIDGNDVIDQFDALSIGMNYNLSAPAAPT